MAKLYFRLDNQEFAYDKETILDQMRFEGIEKLSIFEAERETGVDHFYCQALGFVGLVGERCGKECESYKPRNGKNGRCVHSGYCYTQTDKSITLSINPQQPK